MRGIKLTGLFAVFACSLAGCGSGNAAKVEKVNAQLVSEMMQIADAIEKGDKEAMKAGMERYKKLRKDNLSLKVTVNEKKKIDAIMKGETDKIKTRFTEVGMKAATSGKFTPAELQQLMADLSALDN